MSSKSEDSVPLMSKTSVRSTVATSKSFRDANSIRGRASETQMGPSASWPRLTQNETRSLKTIGRNDSFKRRPVCYQAITGNSSVQSGTVQYDENTVAAINRYKYYSRLDPSRGSSLLMPDHVVPSQFFYPLPVTPTGKQSSIITIFSIWNTMMGTSLLSMPWGLGESGFGCGIGIIVVMGILTLYTSYRVMKSVGYIQTKGEILEFSDVCKKFLGKWGEYSAVFFSLAALLGAMIVYWVLMSNFLYNTVRFIFGLSHPLSNHTSAPSIDGTTLCATPYHGHISNSTTYHLSQNGLLLSTGLQSETDTFNEVWDQRKTVPFFLIILLFPLVNFKSPTFFTKFNALGTISVLYLLVFVTYKVSQWGFHLNFDPPPAMKDFLVPQFLPSFPNLTGILALAFFIHNCVLTILRNQKNPENNSRDLSIAYFCVGVTYLLVGVLFYAGFPLPKKCIADNLLDNFGHNDILAFAARIFLLFQMTTVFPLITYMIRLQFMHAVFGNIYPSLKHVIILNVVLIAMCILFAVFLPQIGTIIRFAGAFCGVSLIFALPCLIYMLKLKQDGRLTWPMIAIHSFIIFLGVANFVGQFLTLSH
ncbi:sodium-coupled neutral amino acid transporter 9 isoform X2 [Lingula anatina]|uniref:Sodium-coupled neutral amino acid transporter 9 isoform X2 n=1 Tax=Lingula anatina TaxID=7574 RepID=A0A1S3KA10_LINAN|nr:sodium-coupled neutral amino acid transporter 9 isoform X2 [Lingula anatina]|eukprot:XP_013419465.1 sodium-coupled neutral amino acid transporter 9 isoform X2 [Lingula anatina]